MSSGRKYEIRQAILDALAGIYPGGRTTERLMAAADLVALRATREEVLAELAVLEAGGFVLDVRRGQADGSYWKATYTGILQIRRETTPDPTVWGEAAL
jgi:hypothetical protein